MQIQRITNHGTSLLVNSRQLFVTEMEVSNINFSLSFESKYQGFRTQPFSFRDSMMIRFRTRNLHCEPFRQEFHVDPIIVMVACKIRVKKRRNGTQQRITRPIQGLRTQILTTPYLLY